MVYCKTYECSLCCNQDYDVVNVEDTYLLQTNVYNGLLTRYMGEVTDMQKYSI